MSISKETGGTSGASSSSIQKGTKGGGMSKKAMATIAVVVLVAAGAAAYMFVGPKGGGPGQPVIIKIDGSSTVYPITAAWAHDFNGPTRQVVVAFSGTGGGFQKWCRGETDLSDASRPIRASETADCAAHNITGIVGYKVAYDGLSIVVNPGNNWATSLTVKELCRIWTSNMSAEACGGAGPHVTKWVELNTSWPDATIKLYGPGTDSGTFDFFKEVILTKYTTDVTDQFFPSEDDNVLVQAVFNEPNALGYFGYAYVVENPGKVKLLAIDDGNATNGAGPILPSFDSIRGGTYVPLGRPLFVYANANSHAKPEAKDFIRFGLSDAGQDLVDEVGYVDLTPAERLVERAKIPS